MVVCETYYYSARPDADLLVMPGGSVSDVGLVISDLVDISDTMNMIESSCAT